VITYAEMKFAEKVRKLMDSRGWKAADLARASGLSASTIARVMTQGGVPGIDTALAIAKAVGVSLDYLADDALDEPPPATEERSEADAMILALAKTWGYAQAAMRLQVIQPPPFAVEPPDKSPDAR
jgi:transcriptional regulator with XRE-family HTH domain